MQASRCSSSPHQIRIAVRIARSLQAGGSGLTSLVAAGMQLTDRIRQKKRRKFPCRVCTKPVWLEPLDDLLLGDAPQWVEHPECSGLLAHDKNCLSTCSCKRLKGKSISNAVESDETSTLGLLGASANEDAPEPSCGHCGERLRQNVNSPGRQRSYCSPSCRTMAYRKRKQSDGGAAE